VCHAAKIRMPDRKADYILRCFECVKRLGGPEAAKAQLLRQPGRDGKIRFLEAFPGIGPKYARNIMMDVYHEDFRDSIALDVRIKAISEALGLSFASYDEHEAFYIGVAEEAGINGWELDRLLFNFRRDVEFRLGVSGGAGSVTNRRWWSSAKLDRLAVQFFKTFARFEYALKAAGYHKGDGNAKPDWDRFAQSIDSCFEQPLSDALAAAVKFLIETPPKRQVLVDGKLEWEEAREEGPDSRKLSIYIRRVRNNLFHGGKFNGHWFSPERSEPLMAQPNSSHGNVKRISRTFRGL
jgi:hypothetical protein